MATPQPNWYLDPHDPTLVRWWDGTRWTEATQPAGVVAPNHVQPRWGGLALGLGIAGWCLSFFPLIGLALGITSVVLASLTLQRTSRPGALRDGRGLAIAGLILGIISILAVPAALILQYQ